MLKSLSTSLIVRGILAVIVGAIALAWPGVTVLALVILFAVYAFIAAGLQAARAFSSPGAGPVFGHLLLGLVDLAAGVVALAWPGPTALVLVLIVGVWAIVAGLVEIAAAFQAGEHARTRALFILGGWSGSRSAWCCAPVLAWAQSPWRCCSACSTSSTGPGRSSRASSCAAPARPCTTPCGKDRGLSQVTPDRCAAASALAHPPGWPARTSPTSARPRPGGHDVAPGPARHSARRAIRPSAAAASSGR